MFCAQCGTSNKDSDRFCTQCGAALAQNPATAAAAQPAPAILAAADLGLSGPAPVLHRDGNRLIVPRGVTALPPYCLKCGEPADKSVNKNFGWHNPWLYLLILINMLVYAIVATVVMKKQRLVVYLCDAHMQRRKTFIWIGVALLLACIPFGAFIGNLPEVDGGWGVLAFFLTMVAGFVCLVIGTRLMVAKEIDDVRGVYSSVSPAFLDRIALQARGAAGR